MSAPLLPLGRRRGAGFGAVRSCTSRAGARGPETQATPRDALEHFEAARHYPHNLGEGKHLLTLERDLDYFSGLAARTAGRYGACAGASECGCGAARVPGNLSYFQALALRELGNEEAHARSFRSWREFAAKQMETEPKIDYFATSLPNLLLFDDDLRKRNHLNRCCSVRWPIMDSAVRTKRSASCGR